MSLAIIDARILTLGDASGDDRALPARPRRGRAMRELGIREKASVLIQGGVIRRIADNAAGVLASGPRRIIDAAGRVLMPGFVDAHTHACWAGDRLDEWSRRLAGEPYLEILRSGGGIMATVRAVRAASEQELAARLSERLTLMLREGSTTIEVKSGYGLTTDDELKMLRAIRTAGGGFSGTVVPTALLGHAMDAQRTGSEQAFVDEVIGETLPAVMREFPGIAVDAYCEKGAWSVEQCVRLFEAAKKGGRPVRVHADQFNPLGMVAEAVRLGAVSVDHLEASGDEEIGLLAKSDRTFAGILPLCGLHMDDRYAPGRRLVDAGAAVVVATNFNPGSAPSGSMPMAIAAAVRRCGLTPAEAITASTVNAACLLGLTDRGVIAPGARADLVLLRHRDERALAYEFGMPSVDVVVCGGQVLPA